MSSPTPQLVRIGVRNKGCAGLSYHLEYVDSPAKFDEVVEQDGVKVVIDSKALFSIIGSEMDWHEGALRYVPPELSGYPNPISKLFCVQFTKPMACLNPDKPTLGVTRVQHNIPIRTQYMALSNRA